MGKIFCRFSKGRKAIGCPAAFVVPTGTGAPDKRNRGPIVPGRIGLNAPVHAVPSFGEKSGFDPVNAVVPPLDAKNAYALATQIFVAFPVATSELIAAACAGLMPVKVRAIGLSNGITGIVAEAVRFC